MSCITSTRPTRWIQVSLGVLLGLGAQMGSAQEVARGPSPPGGANAEVTRQAGAGQNLWALRSAASAVVCDACPVVPLGVLGYNNETPCGTFVKMAQDLYTADDLEIDLDPSTPGCQTGTCTVGSYSVTVVANTGGPFDITTELYTDNPCGGGVPIPNTIGNFSGIPDGGTPYCRTVDLSSATPPVIISSRVYVLVTFSTNDAGWVIAEDTNDPANEIGCTNATFAYEGQGCQESVTVLDLDGNPVHAGFKASIVCADCEIPSDETDCFRVGPNAFKLDLNQTKAIEGVFGVGYQAGGDPAGIVELSGTTPFDSHFEIKRTEQLNFCGPSGTPDSTAIVVTKLDLVKLSVADGVVVIRPDGLSVFYSVRVELSEQYSSEGTLTATKDNVDGGTFTADFGLCLTYSFCRMVGDVEVCETKYEACGDQDPIAMKVAGPWASSLNTPSGCAGQNPPCSEKFIPLIGSAGPTQCRPQAAGSGPGVWYRMEAPECIAGSCTGGVCCVPGGNVCDDTVPNQGACTVLGGQWKGDGTRGTDADQDGLCDWIELPRPPFAPPSFTL